MAYKFPVQCPKCNKEYNLTVNDPTTLLKENFVCRKCGYYTPFVKVVSALAQYQERRQAQIQQAAPMPIQKTQPINVPTPAAKPAGVRFLNASNSREITVPQGVHIMGRDSSDSKATLKIAPDPCMSREAARLVVASSANGMIAQITALPTKNVSYVNDKALSEGKTLILKPGDKIILGDTQLIFLG